MSNLGCSKFKINSNFRGVINKNSYFTKVPKYGSTNVQKIEVESLYNMQRLNEYRYSYYAFTNVLVKYICTQRLQAFKVKRSL